MLIRSKANKYMIGQVFKQVRYWADSTVVPSAKKMTPMGDSSLCGSQLCSKK